MKKLVKLLGLVGASAMLASCTPEAFRGIKSDFYSLQGYLLDIASHETEMYDELAVEGTYEEQKIIEYKGVSIDTTLTNINYTMDFKNLKCHVTVQEVQTKKDLVAGTETKTDNTVDSYVYVDKSVGVIEVSVQPNVPAVSTVIATNNQMLEFAISQNVALTTLVQSQLIMPIGPESQYAFIGGLVDIIEASTPQAIVGSKVETSIFYVDYDNKNFDYELKGVSENVPSTVANVGSTTDTTYLKGVHKSSIVEDYEYSFIKVGEFTKEDSSKCGYTKSTSIKVHNKFGEYKIEIPSSAKVIS